MSAVSGTELYAEQIQFYLAGQNCLIRQSAITEDPYIIDSVPLDDIAFKNASVVVLASNGIYPTRYIDVHVPLNELVTFQLAVNGLVVYLSYNTTVPQSTVNSRAQKAIKILQDAFGVELFEQVDASSRTFTLYGVAPDWRAALSVTTSQLPKDGYFKYLDSARLGSASYTASKHLSCGFASINRYGGSLGGFSIGGISDLLSLLDFNTTEITNFLGLNFTGDVPQVFGSRTNLVFVQYEGATDSITFASQAYTFNAKKALGMPEGAQFKPSAMIWNSMFNFNPVGILGTMIDVNVITGNVTSWDLGTSRLTMDDTILDTIYMASALGRSMGIDIVAILDALEFVIKNVFFITSWEKSGALSKLYTNVNLTRAGYEELLSGAGLNPDLLDFLLDEIMLDTSPLALVGFRGLPYVPAGLLKAIPNVIVGYKKPESNIPVVIAQLDTDFSVKPFQETIQMTLNVTNIGTSRAWGIKIGHGTSSLAELTNNLINYPVSVDYEVRGFLIPALASVDPLSVFYGIENIMINIASYSGQKWIVEPVLPTPGYGALLLLDSAGPSGRPGRNDGYVDFHEVGLLSPSDPYNYIEPGKSMIIDLSDASLTGMFIPFSGENSTFTSASLLAGNQVPPPATNNETNAFDLDGIYWQIDTIGVGINRAIKIEFEFANTTNNVTRDDVSALEFRYVGYNNATIWSGGNASFMIWNYNTNQWVPVSNLTRAPVSINQTSILSSVDIFRIYDGDNDTANNTINIKHYMAPMTNEVKIQLHLGNNASTRLSIDSFDMDYLRRNQTLMPIPQQSFAYTDRSSLTALQAVSNSLYVGSQNASALVVKQRMAANVHSVLPGTSTSAIISIVNKGNRTATNINISIPIPGIITSLGSFTINGKFLNHSVASIAAGASVTMTCDFIVPNSEKIPGVLVSYANQTRAFIVRGNDWYIDAYVDYKSFSLRPYLIDVNATMSHVNPSSIPDISQTFGINYSVSIAHASPLTGALTTSLPGTSYFTISGPNPVDIVLSGNKGSVVKTYTKNSYKGYLVPSINFNTELMAMLLRYVPPAPVAIGEMEITIKKQIVQGASFLPASFRVVRGTNLVVIVTINNTGTLNVGAYEKLALALRQGFTIDDNFGYNQAAFEVLKGDVSVSNVSLAPGQSISFNYTMQAKKVGSFKIGSVVKSYYFLKEKRATSNYFTVVIDEKPELVAIYLGTSTGVTILIVFGSIYTKKKQDKALEDFKRRDRVLYDELAGSKRTYDEYLDDGGTR
ncbi:MAG: BatD family protein [Candidatus Sigynarchaeota archaeon]